MKRRPKKFLNNSNKMLTALVCILAVVCLVAGGIYIDTFHGQPTADCPEEVPSSSLITC